MRKNTFPDDLPLGISIDVDPVGSGCDVCIAFIPLHFDQVFMKINENELQYLGL
jgi:hypothetical protein